MSTIKTIHKWSQGIVCLTTLCSAHGWAIQTVCNQPVNGRHPSIILEDILITQNFDAIFSNKATGTLKKISLNRQAKSAYTVGKDLYDSQKRTEVIEVVVPDYLGAGVNYSASCEFTNPTVAAMRAAPQAPRAPRAQHQEHGVVSLAKLQGYADQQARTVANRVMSTYGQQENFNFQFVRGMQDGYLSKKIFLPSNELYRNGQRDGVIYARERAEKEALLQAQREGAHMAHADARARHMDMVYSSVLDSDLNLPNIPFDAALLIKSLNINSKMTDYFTSINGDIVLEFSKYSYGEDIFTITHTLPQNFAVSTWFQHQGKYEMLESYFKDQYAFNEWTRNGLGGKYDYHLYDQMSPQQQTLFAKEFKRIYNQVIGQKLETKVKEPNQAAYQRGIFWGKNTADKESYYRGYENAFCEHVVSWGTKLFTDEFTRIYTSQFRTWLDYFDQNVELDLNFTLSLSTKRPGYFNLVGHVLNLGGQSLEEARVNVTSPFLAQANIRYKGPIYPHSRRDMRLEHLVSFKEEVEADTNYEFTLEFGNVSKTFKFSVQFQDIVTQYATATDAKLKRAMKESILKSILKEWNANSGVWSENIYYTSLEKNLRRSYLGQLVQFAQKPKFNKVELYHGLKALERPGAWIHFNKNSSFHTLVDRLRP